MNLESGQLTLTGKKIEPEGKTTPRPRVKTKKTEGDWRVADPRKDKESWKWKLERKLEKEMEKDNVDTSKVQAVILGANRTGGSDELFARALEERENALALDVDVTEYEIGKGRRFKPETSYFWFFDEDGEFTEWQGQCFTDREPMTAEELVKFIGAWYRRSVALPIAYKPPHNGNFGARFRCYKNEWIRVFFTPTTREEIGKEGVDIDSLLEEVYSIEGRFATEEELRAYETVEKLEDRIDEVEEHIRLHQRAIANRFNITAGTLLGVEKGEGLETSGKSPDELFESYRELCEEHRKLKNEYEDWRKHYFSRRDEGQ